MNWILWSEYAQIAIIVIPEEAEILLSLLNGKSTSPTYLMSYAAPITRKMLHFNDFKYYCTPSVPKYWQAPMWLKIEVGIFSGRLYFDFSEYADIKRFLGVKEHAGVLAEGLLLKNGDAVHEDFKATDQSNQVPDGLEEAQSQSSEDGIDIQTQVGASNEVEPQVLLTKKPLAFMQEWISVRRKGQDFAQTPMGFVCHGKPLDASHPFFISATDEVKQPGRVKHDHRYENAEQEHVDDDDDFDGDDHLGVTVDKDEVDNFNDDELDSSEGQDTESSMGSGSS